MWLLIIIDKAGNRSGAVDDIAFYFIFLWQNDKVYFSVWYEMVTSKLQ